MKMVSGWISSSRQAYFSLWSCWFVFLLIRCIQCHHCRKWWWFWFSLWRSSKELPSPQRRLWTSSRQRHSVIRLRSFPWNEHVHYGWSRLGSGVTGSAFRLSLRVLRRPRVRTKRGIRLRWGKNSSEIDASDSNCSVRWRTLATLRVNWMFWTRRRRKMRGR